MSVIVQNFKSQAIPLILQFQSTSLSTTLQISPLSSKHAVIHKIIFKLFKIIYCDVDNAFPLINIVT